MSYADTFAPLHRESAAPAPALTLLQADRAAAATFWSGLRDRIAPAHGPYEGPTSDPGSEED